MKKVLILLSMAIFIASSISCSSEKSIEKRESVEISSSSIPLGDNSQTSLDWKGVYKGTLPCADCEGIETSLSLEDETNYVLKTNYLGKNKNSTNEVRGVYSWNEAGNTIILSGIVTSPVLSPCTISEGFLLTTMTWLSS